MIELKSGEYTFENIKSILPFKFLEEKRAVDLLALSHVMRFEEGGDHYYPG